LWLPKTDPEYCSLRVPYSSKLPEPTKPRRNIRAQNQEKRQPENCLCKTSRSGIDHPGVSRTSFYIVFQYWSNQRRKENHRYQEKFRRPKRSPPWAKNHRREVSTKIGDYRPKVRFTYKILCRSYYKRKFFVILL